MYYKLNHCKNNHFYSRFSIGRFCHYNTWNDNLFDIKIFKVNAMLRILFSRRFYPSILRFKNSFYSVCFMEKQHQMKLFCWEGNDLFNTFYYYMWHIVILNLLTNSCSNVRKNTCLKNGNGVSGRAGGMAQWSRPSVASEAWNPENQLYRVVLCYLCMTHTETYMY